MKESFIVLLIGLSWLGFGLTCHLVSRSKMKAKKVDLLMIYLFAPLLIVPLILEKVLLLVKILIIVPRRVIKDPTLISKDPLGVLYEFTVEQAQLKLNMRIEDYKDRLQRIREGAKEYSKKTGIPYSEVLVQILPEKGGYNRLIFKAKK